jgi:hypothetical protein
VIIKNYKFDLNFTNQPIMRLTNFRFLLIISLFLITNEVKSQNVCLDFDGANVKVLSTYSGVLGAVNITFEAWVYVNASAPSSNLAIVDYGLNAVGSRNTFTVTASRGINFISGGTNANIGSTANLILDDTWTHVAFVLNNGTGYLYVNGVQSWNGFIV